MPFVYDREISAKSIEAQFEGLGYNYSAVFTDDCTEYRWSYGSKTRDGMIDVYTEIATVEALPPSRVVEAHRFE
jgi:hypothetical protein